MWGHYLISFYRTMTRHRLYAALNVLGLAIGIAAFLVLWLDVHFETSFERWIPHAESIYRLQTTFLGPGRTLVPDDNTMGATLEALRADYPQLVGTRVYARNVAVKQGALITADALQIVDPSFFRVFDLPLVRGDKSTLLQTPDQMLLTESKARAYFGPADPIGQRLTIVRDGETETYRVSGVLKDPPKNSDLTFSLLIPFSPRLIADPDGWSHWGALHLFTYLRFDRPAEARALNADLDAFIDRHASRDLTPPPAHSHLRLSAAPLTDLHLANPKDAVVVATIGAVGLLTLLLAGVNYVNLATARAVVRAREVAVRKVAGASQPSLMGQFLAEALATTLVAALIGLAICELVRPVINATGGLNLTIDYGSPTSILIPLAGVVLAIGVGAGVYPALVLTRFQPAAVLASSQGPEGGRLGRRIREALIVVQFAIAIAFTIATGVIVSQTQYLRQADLGFKRDGLIVVNNFYYAEQPAALLDAWRALPGVVAATGADIAPGVQATVNAVALKQPGVPGDGPSIQMVNTVPDFFQTYRARLLAGRFLDPHFGGDAWADREAPANVVVNQGAARTLGFRRTSEAIGKTILAGRHALPLTIVGVVDSLHFLSPHTPTPDTVYFLNARHFQSALAGVRYAGVDPRAVMRAMQQDWRRVAPDTPFDARSVEDNLEPYYRPDDQRGRLFLLGAAVAVLIGCVGLYGVAAFSTARRVREIGIRKTLGASTGDVVRLLLWQFTRPVLLANLLAWPLAYLAMRAWLAGFDEQIILSPIYFLSASALALVVAFLTVLSHALRAAWAQPAQALRYE